VTGNLGSHRFGGASLFLHWLDGPRHFSARFPPALLVHYTRRMAKKIHKFNKEAERIAEAYRISKGKNFRLKDWEPADVSGVESKEEGHKLLERDGETLALLQEKLWAQDRWALVVILQGMDAAGKDGVVSHVMSGVNPEGCDVTSFKAPSTEELNHDYLWRAHQRMPSRGQIGIFNRSYYEEVLVVRVHKKLLRAEHAPALVKTKQLWRQRYEEINRFEEYLTNNGVVVRKFFLHLSKGEQKKRFLARLDDPQKNWKFSMADMEERGYWKDYQEAYEELIQETSTKHAPWYIVPADNKWYARLVVSAGIVETLESLRLEFPVVDKAKKKELEQVRKLLEKE
jgi:PPK2 family polyphosphate:nucleotide phosphotransferase